MSHNPRILDVSFREEKKKWSSVFLTLKMRNLELENEYSSID